MTVALSISAAHLASALLSRLSFSIYLLFPQLDCQLPGFPLPPSVPVRPGFRGYGFLELISSPVPSDTLLSGPRESLLGTVFLSLLPGTLFLEQ